MIGLLEQPMGSGASVFRDVDTAAERNENFYAIGETCLLLLSEDALRAIDHLGALIPLEDQEVELIDGLGARELMNSEVAFAPGVAGFHQRADQACHDRQKRQRNQGHRDAVAKYEFSDTISESSPVAR